jgi:hypothetical protein
MRSFRFLGHKSHLVYLIIYSIGFYSNWTLAQDNLNPTPTIHKSAKNKKWIDEAKKNLPLILRSLAGQSLSLQEVMNKLGPPQKKQTTTLERKLLFWNWDESKEVIELEFLNNKLITFKFRFLQNGPFVEDFNLLRGHILAQKRSHINNQSIYRDEWGEVLIDSRSGKILELSLYSR